MTKQNNNFIMAISTVVIGCLAGTGAAIVSLFLDLIEKTFLKFKETVTHPYAWTVSPDRRLFSLIIGGIVAAIVWWIISTRMKPIVSLKEAATGKKMSVPTTILHVFTQIFYVATGGSVGRELAPRELGAMLAQVWENFIHKLTRVSLSKEDRQLLIAAAAGAGFAGVYIAPITGAMFSIEILLNKVTKKTVAVSLTMSVIGMLIGSTVKGMGPYYAVSSGAFSPRILLIVLFLGPFCGALGTIFRIMFAWAGKKRAKSKQILWQLPLISAITGAIAMFFPQIMGNGRALAQTSLDTSSAHIIELLLIGALAKAIVTVLSLKAGAYGGTLAPSISIGATTGSAVGILLGLFIPGIQAWQFSVIGASSLLAASQQAPLMAMFMMFEVSHLNYSALLPLSLGVGLAIATSKIMLKYMETNRQS